MPVDSRNRSFATLTHARVRAEQGDVAGALRILRSILVVEPAHSEARELVARLSSGGPAAGGEGSRMRKLTQWLDRIQSRRGERLVP